MGGKGSGGARVGAGRKPKDPVARWLGGNAGKRGGKVAKAAAPGSLPLLPAPRTLLADERAVWNRLAPQACAMRTLLESTAPAFQVLCEGVVLLEQLRDTLRRDGLTVMADGQKKAHPLLSAHRGMMQRVEAGLLRFRLSPIGKELGPPVDEPKDEWAEFDQPGQVN